MLYGNTDIYTRIKSHCMAFDYLSIDRLAATHTGTCTYRITQTRNHLFSLRKTGCGRRLQNMVKVSKLDP